MIDVGSKLSIQNENGDLVEWEVVKVIPNARETLIEVTFAKLGVPIADLLTPEPPEVTLADFTEEALGNENSNAHPDCHMFTGTVDAAWASKES